LATYPSCPTGAIPERPADETIDDVTSPDAPDTGTSVATPEPISAPISAPTTDDPAVDPAIEVDAGPALASAAEPARDGGRSAAREVAPDAVLAAAVDLARAAAVAVGADSVGEHQGVRGEAERVATHAFAATLPGYVGWHWAVTVARISRSRTVTVDEVVLLPGHDALLAPAWVPWEERVRPGDLSPGDLMPPPALDDPRLVPGYVLSDDPAVEEVAFELGLGRERVLSREGRLLAADRWQAGDRGPDAPMARSAPAHCGTCGFYLPLDGSLRAGFGVCGNEITDSDGQVVAVEYGCGAHSEVKAEATPLAEAGELVYDDGEVVSAD
jgi:hypothetical protein